MTRLATAAVVTMSIALGAAPASAHRLDEYLQAMRVDVRTGGIVVELDLTPGASIAPAILAVLDPVPEDELISNAGSADLIRNFHVTLDARPLALRGWSRVFPSPAELQDGNGVVRLVLEAEFEQSRGSHQVVIDNGYRRDVGVYLANVLRPESGAITITAQRRDPRQQTLVIDYGVGHPLLIRASWMAFAALLIAFSWYRRR